jgi:hypothetical protein
MPETPAAKVDWHRLFGLLLMDYFTNSPYVVETEVDLSVQQQFLDVIVVRRGKGKLQEPLPDGLDDLNQYNLITFKSHHEALEDRHLRELTGHFTSYHKLQSPRDQPLPEELFHLYAVCSREPEKLAKQVQLQPVKPGVYDCWRGTDRFRIVVANQLPQTKNNAPLHLFAASGKQVGFGATNYQLRCDTTSTLLRQLFEGYHVEGMKMPYTLDDFYREFVQTHADEILEMLPPERRVKGLSAAELERLLEQQRAAEAAAEAKKPGRASPRRGKK